MLRPPAGGGELLGSVLCTANALPGAGALLALAAALALLALFRVGLLRICLLQPGQNLRRFRGGLVRTTTGQKCAVIPRRARQNNYFTEMCSGSVAGL